jgi:hypothetical protein
MRRIRNPHAEVPMLFELVQVEVDRSGDVIATTPTQPLFELSQHASAMAEFSAARCGIDYGYDAEKDCWWSRKADERTLIFVVRPVTSAGLDHAA